MLENVRTERPEIVLDALIDVRSIIQKVSIFLESKRSLPKPLQEIDSLIQQKDSGNHRKDEAEVLQALFKIPKDIESTSAPEEEDTPSHTPNDASSQNDDSDEGESDSEGSACANDYADEKPVYDEADDVYRCAKLGCGWEVAFGCCHGCQTKYIMEVRP